MSRTAAHSHWALLSRQRQTGLEYLRVDDQNSRLAAEQATSAVTYLFNVTVGNCKCEVCRGWVLTDGCQPHHHHEVEGLWLPD